MKKNQNGLTHLSSSQQKTCFEQKLKLFEQIQKMYGTAE